MFRVDRLDGEQVRMNGGAELPDRPTGQMVELMISPVALLPRSKQLPILIVQTIDAIRSAAEDVEMYTDELQKLLAEQAAL